MASLSKIEKQIRELKAEGHRSNDAYVRVRPLIRKLEIEKLEIEQQAKEDAQ
jgi:hypothetical protein